MGLTKQTVCYVDIQDLQDLLLAHSANVVKGPAVGPTKQTVCYVDIQDLQDLLLAHSANVVKGPAVCCGPYLVESCLSDSCL